MIHARPVESLSPCSNQFCRESDDDDSSASEDDGFSAQVTA